MVATISTFPLSSLAKQVASTHKIFSLVVPFLSRDLRFGFRSWDCGWGDGGCLYLGWVPGWVWWSLIMRLVLRVILGVAPNLVTNEAFIVLHMFSSFYRREMNGINVHGIRVLCCPGKERSDATSSSESSNSFLLSMELACVTVFLSFLSSPYGLTISPSMYGYNVTWSPM